MVKAITGRKLVTAGTVDETHIMQEVEANASDADGPEKVVVADTDPEADKEKKGE